MEAGGSWASPTAKHAGRPLHRSTLEPRTPSSVSPGRVLPTGCGWFHRGWCLHRTVQESERLRSVFRDALATLVSDGLGTGIHVHHPPPIPRLLHQGQRVLKVLTDLAGVGLVDDRVGRPQGVAGEDQQMVSARLGHLGRRNCRSCRPSRNPRPPPAGRAVAGCPPPAASRRGGSPPPAAAREAVFLRARRSPPPRRRRGRRRFPAGR